MDSLTADERQIATTEVIDAYRAGYDGERVNATAPMVLATGMR
jgi:hypothetical protein